ncbi:MAG: LOG family protein [Acidobacteriia bacterium]|nr:LOG family protein [Terriglobia bacterium]
MPDAPHHPRGDRSIAVFGSSEAVPGDPLYEQARAVGRLLATAGYRVVTGGYGGVMEGASRGAVEVGGNALGVACGAFPERVPNRYLSEVVEEPELFSRTRALIETARGYVVLHGKSGTLAELALLWALHRAGSLGRRPVVLLGDGWRPFLRHLVQAGMIESEQFDVTRVVDTPEEALGIVGEFLPNGMED